ncbi:hypothetical protein [Lacihabitans sp. LS3-19]|uniref:hypothetical protein n=1 Tax=Lacihabitans sp. LS3-19 TaxID=2487335 RepID=UPI0020CEB338|nr:hypothetical protein [Lacihabitans sp. LS3-19]
MKKIFLLASIAAIIFACDDSNLKNKVDFEVNVDKIDSLSYRRLTDLKVKLMSESIFGLDENTDFKNYFSDLKIIDSLKRANAYDAYLKTLDVGKMADGGAYQIKTLHKSKTERYELWKLQYISKDRSPYYLGTHIFLSFYRNDSLKNTYEIAKNYKAGNSPSLLITKANARIKTDSVLVSTVTILSDLEKSDTTKAEKLIMIK